MQGFQAAGPVFSSTCSVSVPQGAAVQVLSVPGWYFECSTRWGCDNGMFASWRYDTRRHWKKKKHPRKKYSLHSTMHRKARQEAIETSVNQIYV